MKQLLAAALGAFAASPAAATGGLVCATAGDRPLLVSLTIGHAVVPGIVAATLTEGGRRVPVTLAQSWLDPSELRLDLTDPAVRRHELRLRAKASGRSYDGSLWRFGQRRWVRCREG